MTRITGIDLGSYAIKAIEAERRKDGTVVVTNFQSIPSPINLSIIDDPGAMSTMVSVVEQMVSQNNFSAEVITCVPESVLFSYVLEFPRMNEKELSKSLEYELIQYIPIPLADLSVAHQIVSDSATMDSTNKMEVLVMAVPKKIVARYISVLEHAGLKVAAVENQTNAVIRSLTNTTANLPTSLIISLGASGTDLAIIHQGVVRFNRTLSIGGNVLTRSVAEGIGFEIPVAEEYKRTYGLTNQTLEGKVKKSIQIPLDSVLAEVRKAQTFYHNHYSPDSIKRVTLVGGGALLPGIMEYLASVLDCEVEMAKPSPIVILDANLKNRESQFQALSPLFAISLGLAMKEVKL